MFLREVFFSRLYHRKVEDEAGRRIGLLHDVAVSLTSDQPKVIGIRVGMDGYLPIGSMTGGLSSDVIRVSTDAMQCEMNADEYYAAELLLDKQVLCRRGKRVQRVNDLVFASYGKEDTEERCFFAGVDVGIRGLCRRLGLAWLVRSSDTQRIGWRNLVMVDDGEVPPCLTLRTRRLEGVAAADVAEICRKLDRRGRSLFLGQLPHTLVCKALLQMSKQERSRLLTAFSCEEMVVFLHSLPQELRREIAMSLPRFYRYSRQAKGGDAE